MPRAVLIHNASVRLTPDLELVRRAVDWDSSKQKGLCPLCRKRRLSVNRGRDVEVVAKCWGECDQAEVAAALGLSERVKRKRTSEPPDQKYEEYCRLRDALANSEAGQQLQ